MFCYASAANKVNVVIYNASPNPIPAFYCYRWGSMMRRIPLQFSRRFYSQSPQRPQTVTFSSTPINPQVNGGSWINIGTANASDTGQYQKNLIGAFNTTFEPIINRQQWTAQGTTSSTTVATPDGNAPTNYWVGATFNVPSSINTGAEIGCSSTVTANTAATITFSPACGASIKAGDNVTVTRTVSPTTEADLESGFNSNAGFAGLVSGGGKITAQQSGLCSDCGAQSINLDGSAGGGASAEYFVEYEQNPSQNLFVLHNGNFQLRFNAAVKAGSGTFTVSVARSGGGISGTLLSLPSPARPPTTPATSPAPRHKAARRRIRFSSPLSRPTKRCSLTTSPLRESRPARTPPSIGMSS